MKSNNTILVIATHPDDETLGCGGTLLKHQANGDTIHWLICTTLEEKHPYYKTREKEIEKVSFLYNFKSIHNIKLKTMRVDEYSMSELINKISKVIEIIRPNTVYLPFKGDVHSDHRHIFQAVYSSTKSFRHHYIKKLYMMEVLSETEFAPSTKEDAFIPNTFVDISDYFDKKVEIMRIYDSEIEPHPFPRSIKNIEALAQIRGASANCKFAESFMLLKEII
jgi:LmbE family N-acetylglucosaminyl deacetylase